MEVLFVSVFFYSLIFSLHFSVSNGKRKEFPTVIARQSRSNQPRLVTPHY